VYIVERLVYSEQRIVKNVKEKFAAEFEVLFRETVKKNKEKFQALLVSGKTAVFEDYPEAGTFTQVSVSKTNLHCLLTCLMLYAFFWVIPLRLNFIFRRFGTLCLFNVFHPQVFNTYINIQ